MRRSGAADDGDLGLDVQNREILLVGGVDEASAGRVLTAIRRLDRTRGPIHLVVNSTGGDEDAGWAIYDAMMLARNEVRVEAYGACQSIAVLILQAAELRLLAPNCRLMLHNGSIEVGATINQMRALGPEIEYLTRRYYEVLAERSEQTVTAIKALCDAETYLSSKDALDLGLADGMLIKPRGRKK